MTTKNYVSLYLLIIINVFTFSACASAIGEVIINDNSRTHGESGTFEVIQGNGNSNTGDLIYDREDAEKKALNMLASAIISEYPEVFLIDIYNDFDFSLAKDLIIAGIESDKDRLVDVYVSTSPENGTTCQIHFSIDSIYGLFDIYEIVKEQRIRNALSLVGEESFYQGLQSLASAIMLVNLPGNSLPDELYSQIQAKTQVQVAKITAQVSPLSVYGFIGRDYSLDILLDYPDDNTNTALPVKIMRIDSATGMPLTHDPSQYLSINYTPGTGNPVDINFPVQSETIYEIGIFLDLGSFLGLQIPDKIYLERLDTPEIEIIIEPVTIGVKIGWNGIVDNDADTSFMYDEVSRFIEDNFPAQAVSIRGRHTHIFNLDLNYDQPEEEESLLTINASITLFEGVQSVYTHTSQQYQGSGGTWVEAAQSSLLNLINGLSEEEGFISIARSQLGFDP